MKEEMADGGHMLKFTDPILAEWEKTVCEETRDYLRSFRPDCDPILIIDVLRDSRLSVVEEDIDPPYEYNYQYGFDRIRYHLLTEDARESERNGCQVIACEALGPNGERPTWLPFVESHSQVTSRRKSTQSHHSRELLYVTGGSA